MPDLFDPRGCRFHGGDGHVEAEATMRAGSVVVPDVLGQDDFEVAAVPDQYPVEAFGPGRAYPALGICVRLGAWGGVLIVSIPAAVNTASNAAANLAVAIADGEPEL